MSTCLKGGILGILAVLAMGQENLTRDIQMKRVEDYLGRWKVHGTLLEPPEFKGVGFEGNLRVDWALKKTALEFKLDGFSTTQGHRGPTLQASGILTYNEAAAYVDRDFRASFAWSEDGRMLPLRGGFQDGKLILNGRIAGEPANQVRLKVSGGDKKRIEVFAVNKGQEVPFITLNLTKIVQ